MSALNEKIEAYYAARADYEAKAEIATKAEKLRRGLEYELVELMLEEGVTKISLDDGTTPTLVKSCSASITKDNFDDIREWLRETVGDDSDYVETVVSKPAVMERIKHLIDVEKYDETDLPSFLRVSTRPTIRITGWNKR